MTECAIFKLQWKWVLHLTELNFSGNQFWLFLISYYCCWWSSVLMSFNSIAYVWKKRRRKRSTYSQEIDFIIWKFEDLNHQLPSNLWFVSRLNAIWNMIFLCTHMQNTKWFSWDWYIRCIENCHFANPLATLMCAIRLQCLWRLLLLLFSMQTSGKE